MILKRDLIDKDIIHINVKLEVIGFMISFYRRMIEENGEWDYFDERLLALYKDQAEYLIAREETLEGKR
jgi:hypothetical protein